MCRKPPCVFSGIDQRDLIQTSISRHLPIHPAPTQALSEVGSEDLVQEERTRKAAVRKSRMDADLDAESADLQEKKAVSRTPLALFSSPPTARQFFTVEMLTINFIGAADNKTLTHK